MSGSTTYQCPNCNGVMSFDAATGLLVCQHCGSRFDAQAENKSIPVSGDGMPTQMPVEHVKTVDDFLNRTTWGGTAAEQLAGATTYSCPSCGAAVTADQSVVSTSCPYCGNNMLVQGIATSGNMPSLVLPFSVTKEQAEFNMRQHFEHKWYLSRKFNASLEHMQGVYVPYHLYDMSVDGRADFVAYHESEDSDGNTTYSYYAMQRAGNASFRGIPIDGSSRMPDAHMDAIAPFSLNRMVNFSSGYVTGYVMEVPDETPHQCLSRAQERATTSFVNGLRRDVVQEKGIDGISSVVRQSADVQCSSVVSCVLPVWLAHCTWEGNQMLFAVNGETGKCVGDLPVDKTRRNATRGGIAAAILVLGALLTVFNFSSDIGEALKFAAFVVVGAVVATMFADSVFMRQMKTAVEADNADMSFDERGMNVTYRWRSRKGYGSANKASSVFELGEKVGVFGGGKDYPAPLPWGWPIPPEGQYYYPQYDQAATAYQQPQQPQQPQQATSQVVYQVPPQQAMQQPQTQSSVQYRQPDGGNLPPSEPWTYDPDGWQDVDLSGQAPVQDGFPPQNGTPPQGYTL